MAEEQTVSNSKHIMPPYFVNLPNNLSDESGHNMHIQHEVDRQHIDA